MSPVRNTDPFDLDDFDDSGSMVHQVVDVQAEAARAELETATAILAADPLPADKRTRNTALFAMIEGLRADIRARLDVIEMLVRRGVPKSFVPACRSDDDVRMDAVLLALRVYNQRHAAAMLELQHAPTDADAADPIAALAAAIYAALQQNGRQTFDDLAAHFGTNVPRVVLAVKQLEIAGEWTGARIIRDTEGAEIDALAQQPEPPVRAASAIGGRNMRVLMLPGGGLYASNMRQPQLRRGAVPIDLAKRLVELGVRPAAGRVG